MLASLFANNKEAKFSIHVLYLNISQPNQALLSRFCAEHGADVNFYKVDITGVKFANLEAHYISVESYLRLFISQYIDAGIERLLYLDVDMVVLGDVAELYDMPLGEYVLAAIEDSPRADRVERLHLDEKWGYFNAGMLLINMRQWRNLKVSENALLYLKEHADRIVHHDQDVLNATLCGNWQRVAFKWNMLNTFFYHIPGVKSQYLEELGESKKDIRVIHYTGNIKPWHAWEKNPYHNEYYKYLRLTPYRGYKPSLKSRWQSYSFPRNLLNVLCIDRLLLGARELYYNLTDEKANK